MRNKEGRCDKFGFYQANYFCDTCRLLEKDTFATCLNKTKENLLNGKITQKDISKLKG